MTKVNSMKKYLRRYFKKILYKTIFHKNMIKLFYLIIGRFLFSSPTWYHIKKHCYHFPGKNWNVEIEKISPFLYHLYWAYYEYFSYKYRKLEQREWQKVRIDDYADNYYSTRSVVPLDADFVKIFEIMTEHTESVIEIGAGGFNCTKRLSIKFPHITFYAFDISELSLIIYDNEIKSIFEKIKFEKCSIFERLGMINQIPFFYTYNVLMTFDEKDINEFFLYLQGIEKPVFGILQEPYSGNEMSYNFQERDYKHNYTVYFEKYHFKLINFINKLYGYAVIYFVTK